MIMKLRLLEETNVFQKTVLYRSAYDIGVRQLADGSFVVKDDSRIKASLKTLEYLIKNQCRIVILTSVKRPDGKIVESLRTTPQAKALSELLGRPVKKVDDCVGEEVRLVIAALHPGEMLMLENTRFHPEEMVDDDAFAKELTKGCDVVVFDGFPQAHRAHASTTGILRHLPSCAGFYLEEEVTALEKLMIDPPKPFTIVIGGEKISDKTEAINNLYDMVDNVLVGGAVANVFLNAKGVEARGNKVHLPVDLVWGEGRVALDIGPETAKSFADVIAQSKTVFWCGPMGVFEDERYANGSKVVAKAMENVSGLTVIAGGDTIEAAKKFCDVTKISHLSLAGGATLEFLAGKKLPVLEMLRKLV